MMKKLLLFLLALGLFGCGEADKPSDGKLQISAGIAPVAFVVKKIAGDAVNVNTVLPVGRSPHDYTPGPQEVRDLMSSAIFFSSGMPFEENLMRPLAGSKVKVVDLDEKIQKIPFDGDCCDEDDHDADHHDAKKEGDKKDNAQKEAGHDHDGHHHHDGLDPHIWLSPANLKIIAAQICEVLSEKMPQDKSKFEANLAKFNQEADATENYIKTTLAPYQGRSFYVYHPGFGYFAQTAGLKQSAIELGGREPSPAHLLEIIRQAQKDGVKVVFVQMQFNPNSANALATAIKGKVAPLDSLAEDVLTNMKQMADLIKEGFETK